MSENDQPNGRRPEPNPDLETERDIADTARRGPEIEDADLDDIDLEGADIPNLAAGVEEMMRKLERADELERELADAKGRLARLYADFENYRRRTSEDVLESKGRGEASAVEALLPVYDDLSRAIDSGVKDPGTLLPGLRSVRENFLKSLARFGVEEVPGRGAPFDPAVHEALTMVPGDEDDKVVEVYQAGFRLRGHLIRPARVVVSRK